ncbi:MAG: FHA domain-containing protein, partial [Acidobacteria bacterium]|nr:FHA domain-containing protein [Acidobacteriota bacterium]
MPLELIVRSAAGAQRVVRLEADRYSFGRAANNDFSFPEDGELSRQHLAFERFGAGWLVVDQGSRNGTQVNGKPISGKKLLRPGDCVTAGRLSIDYGDPNVAQDRSVVFVDKPDQDAGSSIVSVSLDGLMARTRAISLAEAPPMASVSQMAALIQAG